MADTPTEPTNPEQPSTPTPEQPSTPTPETPEQPKPQEPEKPEEKPAEEPKPAENKDTPTTPAQPQAPTTGTDGNPTTEPGTETPPDNMTTAPTTEQAAPTSTDSSGETTENSDDSDKIKFSIGLDSIASASSTAGGAAGGVGGVTGSATLSGEQLAGGWISDATQKQIAMHVTVFHSFPVVDSAGKYRLAVDSIDATGALAAGVIGQPGRWDKGLLTTVSNNVSGGNFKVGASFAIKNHGVEYFSHYYPNINWTYNMLVKLRNNFLLNAEVLVPTGGNQAKAYKVKLVDEGPWHDQKGTGLWILDMMSSYAMLDENQGTFVATAKDVPDLKNSEYKFPYASASYDIINGEIPGYSPAEEIKWIDEQKTAAEPLNIIANKINGLQGTCRVKFFIDPSHKAQAESIVGSPLPDELFTCNATYSQGGAGAATIDSGSGIGAFSTAGASQEMLDKYINKPIQFSPQNYPPLQKISLKELQSDSSIFGRHGSKMVSVPVPANYPLHTYSLNGKRTTSISCHPLIAERLKCVLNDIINHYGADIMAVAPGACIYHGSYNDRKITGGNSWSSHAYGVALDFDADNNALKTHAPQARLSQAIYKPFWEIWYHHGFYSQGIETDLKRTRRGSASDWMHIQAVHYGTP